MPAPANAPSLDADWMPVTTNRQFKAAPRLLVAAQGLHYTASDGRTVLNGTAGLWCVNAGHGWRAIAAAVERQLTTFDFAPSFQMGPPSRSTSPSASPASRRATRSNL